MLAVISESFHGLVRKREDCSELKQSGKMKQSVELQHAGESS
jgi:hypothetical protein